MKTECEIREIRDIARRSIDPECPGCHCCRDWKFIIDLTDWILDGNSAFDRANEEALQNLAKVGR